MARPTAEDGAPDLDARARERLAGARLALVVSSYHRDVVAEMAASARDLLADAGVAPSAVAEVEVPGAFELPLAAQRLARRDDVDAVLCFGLVLKGETEHDRHIAAAVSKALMDVGLAADKPVLFGVLTCDDLEQARRRAKRGRDGGLDKGAEVARAAVEQLLTLARIDAIPERTR